MRPAKATIDLSALCHNYQLAKKLHGGHALAVIKADAYGHGALSCAKALSPIADGFAVAFVQEALALREAGLKNKILALEGAFDSTDLLLASQHQLDLVFHHPAQLAMLESAHLATGLTAWLKLNTGMNRVGFEPEELKYVWERLRAHPGIKQIIFITHLAQADEPQALDAQGNSPTDMQIARFNAAISTLPGQADAPRSLANSAGILAWPNSHQDWARPGIMLYGINPMPNADPSYTLKPVMSLESRIFATRMLMPGQALGYGATFVATAPTRVGLVAMGYADGYPRTAPNGTPVWAEGGIVPLIGRVSMDMLTIDLSQRLDLGIGSTVEFWGKHVPINEIAQSVGTISYELLCHVKRVARHYTHEENT